MGFISLLLCLIYVSGGAGKGSLSELSLKSHLNKLGMETDSDVMGLGDLHKLLQKASSDGYIVIQKVTGADGTAETSYIWGPRAKVEFPEDSIVDLIASVGFRMEDSCRANTYRHVLVLPEPRGRNLASKYQKERPCGSPAGRTGSVTTIEPRGPAMIASCSRQIQISGIFDNTSISQSR